MSDYGYLNGKPITAHWEVDLPSEEADKPNHAVLNFTGPVTKEALENLRAFLIMELDIRNGVPAGTSLLKEQRKRRGMPRKNTRPAIGPL